jgi:hypothetical protein
MSMGTPAYMSPEVCRGQEADVASDIYSLGAMMYELVTGRKPFESADPYAVMGLHVNERPPDPVKFAPELPSKVCAVLMHGLEKDPTRRFSRAAVTVEALAAAQTAPTKGPTASTPPRGTVGLRPVAEPVKPESRAPVAVGPKPKRSLVLALALVGVVILGSGVFYLMSQAPSGGGPSRPPGGESGTVIGTISSKGSQQPQNRSPVNEPPVASESMANQDAEIVAAAKLKAKSVVRDWLDHMESQQPSWLKTRNDDLLPIVREVRPYRKDYADYLYSLHEIQAFLISKKKGDNDAANVQLRRSVDAFKDAVRNLGSDEALRDDMQDQASNLLSIATKVGANLEKERIKELQHILSGGSKQ